MMRFSYTILHVPGKSLCTADALLRAPLARPLNHKEKKLETDVQAYVDSIVKYLPATESRLEELRSQQQQDEVTRQPMTYSTEGWPDRFHLPGPLKPYWPERDELNIQQGLLMKGNGIVIPVCMQLDVPDKLHDTHQGIAKCREHAQASVWWPGLSKQLEDLVNKCITCIKKRVNAPDPAIPSELPDRLWQKIAADLFELKGQPYLLVIDYFSCYIAVAKLSGTTSPAIFFFLVLNFVSFLTVSCMCVFQLLLMSLVNIIININKIQKKTPPDIVIHLKSMFARHGIPDQLLSDNGP